jgi:very-short-patch-repair endonuclease
MDLITCEICNCKFKRITKTHLKKHGIDTNKYKELYPNSPIVCESLAHDLGKGFRENNPMHNDEYKQKVVNALTGIKRSEETKQKLSKIRTGVSWGSHTEEHKEFMRVFMIGEIQRRFAAGWKCQPGLGFFIKTQEQRDAAGARLKELNRLFPDLMHPKGRIPSPEAREKQSIAMCNYIKNNPTKKKDTDIELLFKEFLNDFGIIFEHQFIVNDVNNRGQWLYDFYIPDLHLLVEVDGEYFHTISKQQIVRDRLKQNSAWKQGYNFIRISNKNWIPELIFVDNETQKKISIEMVETRYENFIKTEQT